jgi:polar amino acid transport system substrate-binding protein
MYVSKKLLTLGLVALVGLLLSGPLLADDPDLAASSTLEAILANGKITVCSDIPFEPFEFEDDQGNLVGFDVDIIRLMAKEMGVDWEFVNTPFDTIIPALNARNCDLIASDITATLSRALSANFTAPYLETGQIVMVSTTKSPGKDVTEYPQLNNSNVIITVQLGTTGEEAARTFFPKADIRTFDNAQLALQEVVDGRADAIVFDEVFLRPQAANVAGKAELCCPLGNPELLTKELISLAIRKGDPDFLTWLNLFMTQAKSTIRVTEELVDEFDLPAETIGLPFLEAIRVKWGV